MRMSALLVVLTAAVIVQPGCCRTCSSETATLMETLDVASAIGNARHLAQWSEQSLERAAVEDGDKADMRARIQILAAHADKLADALDRFDETGRTNTSITLDNLKIRGRALEAETQTVQREWAVWTVRHGMKKPEEVFEFTDVRELVEAGRK